MRVGKGIIQTKFDFPQAVRALLHSDVPSTLQALLNPDFGVLLKALVHRLLAETVAYHSIRFEPESHLTSGSIMEYEPRHNG